MKKEILRIVSYVFLSVTMSMFFISCEKDKTEPEHHHEEPVKAELLLVKGHLHGEYHFHQNPEIAGVNHLKVMQKLTYVHTEGKGWTPMNGSATKFRVLANEEGHDHGDEHHEHKHGHHDGDGHHHHHHGAVYGLIIKYFSEDGDLVNQEFIEEGKDKVHQHFFIPQKDGNKYEHPLELLHYTYCDTDPWNKSLHSDKAKLIGDKNPIGMKGYFEFKKEHEEFDLNIKLMHASPSKFNEDGKASPFYEPSKAQLQTAHWDVTMKVPVVVYACSADHLEGEYDLTKTDEELKKQLESHEEDKEYVEAIMNAYGISLREVLTDIHEVIHGSENAKPGELYF